MKPLAEPALRASREGKVRFTPEWRTKIYENWLENIRDWCISRQLWWGHRIPVWYCQTEGCDETIVAREDPTCPKCGGTSSSRIGRAGHLVLLVVAVLDARLAGRDARAQGVLPDSRPEHRIGDPVLLGRAHDHGGPRVHGRGPVQRRVPAQHGPGSSGPKDVEVAGERDRPAGGGPPLRRGCAALHGHRRRGRGDGRPPELPGR